MRNQDKNLLSKIIFKRVALICTLSKIKLGFLNKFSKLTLTTLIIFTLLGYYPNLSIPPVRKSVVEAANEQQQGEVIAQSFSKPLLLPHPGYLSTRFSSWHPGIDIATGLGMPIRPITSGIVSLVGRDFWGLGNFVEVSHENGFRSKYAHMGKVYVKAGQEVTSENILGEVGLTGRTSGPHTHLEITKEGRFVDPQAMLPEIPNLPLLPKIAGEGS